MTTFRLDGRVGVVTGALGRLGPVWASALLDAGGIVVGVDREDAPIPPAFAALVEEHGDKRVSVLRADVRSGPDLRRALARCRELHGTPSILVNNAGIDAPPGDPSGRAPRVETVDIESFRAVLDVNTVGAFLATQIFGGAMVEARRGTIVNIGSLYASVAPDARFYDHLDPPFLKPPAYGASKAALVNLTKYLATAWGPAGVRVNALSPGGVRGDQDPEFRSKFTARVPLGRMAEHADLIGPLLFLASDASAYVTGIDLRVDGGFTAW